MPHFRFAHSYAYPLRCASKHGSSDGPPARFVGGYHTVSIRTSICPVTPFRLDLTAQALRRLNSNIVDVVSADGTYLRAFSDERGVNIVEVRQSTAKLLDVRITGRNAPARLGAVTRMLGVDVDLRAWSAQAAKFPWLAKLAKDLRGVKPPCYPDLWEASCNAIIFQQLSIVAAAAIMRRFVERFSTPVEHHGVQLYPFPSAETILQAADAQLQGLGVSRQKVTYLKDVALATASRSVTSEIIESLSTEDALLELQKIRGIGRWASANILLRGFRRLDVFPPSDSGAVQSIKILSGDPDTSLDAVLTSLGDTRGMLYFHFLLGRLRLLEGLS